MKSIKRNYLFNILLNVSSVVFPLITAPYVSRVLEPDGIGLYNFSGAYSGYFALVALLGIPFYGVREVSKIRDDKNKLSLLVSQLMSIAGMVTVAVTAIYLLTIAFIGQLTENYIIFLIAGFAIYLAPLKINWLFEGLEEFGYITLRSLIVRTISVICLFLFVRQKDDLVIYVILNILGGVGADVWNYVKMLKAGIRPRFTVFGVKVHLRPLFILFVSYVAISIYTILDSVMLGFMTDYSEVGYYNNAIHLSKTILMGVTSLSLVALTRVSYYMRSKDYKNINQLMDKSFSIVTFLAFPLAFGLMCIAPTFVPLFFGEKFVGSIIPLMILSTLIVFIGYSNLTGIQILIGMGFDKAFLYSVSTGTIANIVLNCLLIPVWGAIGASVASVVAEMLIAVVTASFVYRLTPIRFNNKTDIFKTIFGSMLFIPLIINLQKILSGWTLVVMFVLIGGAVYIILEYMMRNTMMGMVKSFVAEKLGK